MTTTTCADHDEAAQLLAEAAQDLVAAAIDWGVLHRSIPATMPEFADYVDSRREIAARAARVLMQQTLAARDGTLDLDRADAFLDAAHTTLDQLDELLDRARGVIA